ncbi:MAG: HD domain-containing protein [Actinomycetota bacterium]|nr:HD domain-containing protein [Actinomycetota bacterium]
MDRIPSDQEERPMMNLVRWLPPSGAGCQTPAARNAALTVGATGLDEISAMRALIDSDIGLQDVRALGPQTIRRWAVAAEAGDRETPLHIERMSRYSAILARTLGLDDARCEEIRIAAQLHDVGKVGLPDEILSNPALLSQDERDVAEEHCEIGHRILSGWSSLLLDLAAEIALTHHERVDGTGYPHGLFGSEIPLAGRIAAIADVFDALTSERPYRAAWSVEGAVEFMSSERGTHFNHELLDRFFVAMPEILEVKQQYPDPVTERGTASQLR